MHTIFDAAHTPPPSGRGREFRSCVRLCPLSVSLGQTCVLTQTNFLRNFFPVEFYRINAVRFKVLRWTNFACESSKLPKTPENLRNMLSTAVLGLVRFPTISTKDFAYVVGNISYIIFSSYLLSCFLLVPSKILTLQEERDILLTKRLADYQPENPLPYSKISRGRFALIFNQGTMHTHYPFPLSVKIALHAPFFSCSGSFFASFFCPLKWTLKTDTLLYRILLMIILVT